MAEVGSRDGAVDLTLGFHPLPLQTVLEVLPHTAFLEPFFLGLHRSMTVSIGEIKLFYAASFLP